MSPNACPSCGGTCCRDTSGARVEHMGAAHYVHDCEACTSGHKHQAALLQMMRERDGAKNLLFGQNARNLQLLFHLAELEKQIAKSNHQRDKALDRARLADKRAKSVRKQVEDAMNAERVAVATYLRELNDGSLFDLSLEEQADKILRGEHLGKNP